MLISFCQTRRHPKQVQAGRTRGFTSKGLKNVREVHISAPRAGLLSPFSNVFTDRHIHVTFASSRQFMHCRTNLQVCSEFFRTQR
jgi:hypothetical protein